MNCSVLIVPVCASILPRSCTGWAPAWTKNLEWLFALRYVDHLDLIASAETGEALVQSHVNKIDLDESDLSSLFGIEIEASKKVDSKKKLKGQKKVLADIDAYLASYS